MAALDNYGIVVWQAPRRRRGGALRYAGVLAVWLGLLVVNPPLAWDIFRNRRADSPIPRLRR
jgi:hypothetical protein